MQQILLSAQAHDVGEQLIALARERGGYDNITVGLVVVRPVRLRFATARLRRAVRRTVSA